MEPTIDPVAKRVAKFQEQVMMLAHQSQLPAWLIVLGLDACRGIFTDSMVRVSLTQGGEDEDADATGSTE